MEISFNGNLGIGRETGDVRSLDSGRVANDAAKASDFKSLLISSRSSQARPADLTAAEPVSSVSDASLTRDDALGNLVKAAFNLPPPPMPAFGDLE